jgi:hypothetical protein
VSKTSFSLKTVRIIAISLILEDITNIKRRSDLTSQNLVNLKTATFNDRSKFRVNLKSTPKIILGSTFLWNYRKLKTKIPTSALFQSFSFHRCYVENKPMVANIFMKKSTQDSFWCFFQPMWWPWNWPQLCSRISRTRLRIKILARAGFQKGCIPTDFLSLTKT